MAHTWKDKRKSCGPDNGRPRNNDHRAQRRDDGQKHQGTSKRRDRGIHRRRRWERDSED